MADIPQPTEDSHPKSRMYVEFDGMNSTLFRVELDHVTALQILALVGYLENRAKFLLTQQEIFQMQQDEKNHIQVPKPQIEIGHK